VSTDIEPLHPASCAVLIRRVISTIDRGAAAGAILEDQILAHAEHQLRHY
jgi:hypothetical protein